MARPVRNGLDLIFDADDTLWDSNIHFLEAEAAFVELVSALDARARAEAVRLALRRHELEIIQSHGYGRRPFVVALRRVAAELLPGAPEQWFRDAVEEIGRRLVERDCELLPGVEPTLKELAARHRLTLFTKGEPAEQLGKLERSGLRPRFSRVEVAAEKDAEAYRRLLASAALEPALTFMIGNSPRSDINPALTAGLHAVYIPHPHTWEHEHEEIDLSDERVVTLASFSRLLDLF